MNESLQNEEDVQKWLEQNQVKYDEITNRRDGQIENGEVLYEKMVKNYTFKQWNKYPDELDNK